MGRKTVHIKKHRLCYKVIQNLFLNCQVLNNPLTRDAKRVRRYYNFDYDFNDWDNATQMELDYTLDLNVNEAFNETIPWNFTTTDHTETTAAIFDSTTTNTTNIVEATNTKNANKATTQKIDFSKTTNVTLHPERANVTVTKDPLDREPVNVTTQDPFLWPEETGSQMLNATNTPNDIMTFPGMEETRSQRTRNIFLENANHSTIPTPKSGIIFEAHTEMNAKGAGYLTTFLLEVFKVMAAKNTTHAAKLFTALEEEVMVLDKADKFHGFGTSTRAAFITIVKLIKGDEPEIVQKQAARGYFLLSNRTANLPAEVVIVMDLADDVYQYEEGERIFAVLEDIEKFPDTPKTDREIAHEVIDAVIMAPFMRIYGSPQEKFLVKKLEQVIVKDFFYGVSIERSKNESSLRSIFKRSKIVKTSAKQNDIQLSISKTYITYKNTITINNPKNVTWKGKKKPKHWRSTQRRLKGRGYTAGKSKKLAQRQINITKTYIKKNLAKYKISKVNNSVNKLINMSRNKHPKNKKYEKINSRKRYKVYNNFPSIKDTRYVEVGKFQISKNIRKQLYSTDVEDEEKFRANVDDAFFHGIEPIFRNRISSYEEDEEMRRNHEESSFSDEETILKANIYKALGYDDNFAKVVKSHHSRRLK